MSGVLPGNNLAIADHPPLIITTNQRIKHAPHRSITSEGVCIYRLYLRFSVRMIEFSFSAHSPRFSNGSRLYCLRKKDRGWLLAGPQFNEVIWPEHTSAPWAVFSFVHKVSEDSFSAFLHWTHLPHGTCQKQIYHAVITTTMHNHKCSKLHTN